MDRQILFMLRESNKQIHYHALESKSRYKVRESEAT